MAQHLNVTTITRDGRDVLPSGNIAAIDRP
jgi:hypothetical protein